MEWIFEYLKRIDLFLFSNYMLYKRSERLDKRDKENRSDEIKDNIYHCITHDEIVFESERFERKSNKRIEEYNTKYHAYNIEESVGDTDLFLCYTSW